MVTDAEAIARLETALRQAADEVDGDEIEGDAHTLATAAWEEAKALFAEEEEDFYLMVETVWGIGHIPFKSQAACNFAAKTLQDNYPPHLTRLAGSLRVACVPAGEFDQSPANP